MRTIAITLATSIALCGLAQAQDGTPPEPKPDAAKPDAAKPDAEKQALEDRVKALEKRLSALERPPEEATPPEEASSANAVEVLKGLTERLELHGDVVGSYVWNTNDPPGRKGRNRFRVSDLDHNTFAPTFASLTLSRSIDKSAGLDWGFALGVAAGQMVEGTLSLDPEFLGGEEINLTEAYVEVQLATPLPVRIKLGRAFGWFGTESLHLGDSQLFSLSVLANFTPYTNTGLFVEVDLLEGLSYMQYVGNGAEVVVDNNDSKTIGGRLSYEVSDSLSFALHWIYGAEQADNEHDQRWQLELDVTFAPTKTTELYLMLHYGQEEGNAVNSAGVAKFGGVSLALRQGFMTVERKGKPTFHHLVALARTTVYRDQGGANSGVDQTLSEFSLGLEVNPLEFLWLRFEWRYDLSSERDVFPGKRGVNNRRHQDTFGVAMGARF